MRDMSIHEMIAYEVAKQVVRTLPKKPCLFPIPFCDITQFSKTEKTSVPNREEWIVFLKAQMASGCFDPRRSDITSWCEFEVVVECNNDGEYSSNRGVVKYPALDPERRVELKFSVNLGEDNHFVVTKNK